MANFTLVEHQGFSISGEQSALRERLNPLPLGQVTNSGGIKIEKR
jgi:hypothetical protein